LTNNGQSKKLIVWPKRQVFQLCRCTSGHGTRGINSNKDAKLAYRWVTKLNKREEMTHKRLFKKAPIKHP